MFGDSEQLEKLFLKARSYASAENWEQAALAYQQLLESTTDQPTPLLRLTATVYRADCLVQQELFEQAQKLLEDYEIIELSAHLEKTPINVEYHMVYAHSISDSASAEKIDHHLKLALKLAQNFNDLNQIESVLTTILYMGHSFGDWNYLLGYSKLALDTADKQGSETLRIYALKTSAQACKELERYDEALTFGSQLKNHYRDVKNVDEFTNWNKFVTEINNLLPKEESDYDLLANYGPDDKITIEDLPQAGDSKGASDESVQEQLAQSIDIPDAISNDEIFEDFEVPTAEPPTDTNESTEKRSIRPASLVPVPQISGLEISTQSSQTSKDIEKSSEEPVNSNDSHDLDIIHEYTLEMFYLEIYKKGHVVDAEKIALQNLFEILKVERSRASEILQDVINRTKLLPKTPTDLAVFLQHVHTKASQYLPPPQAKQFFEQIAKAINRADLI